MSVKGQRRRVAGITTGSRRRRIASGGAIAATAALLLAACSPNGSDGSDDPDASASTDQYAYTDAFTQGTPKTGGAVTILVNGLGTSMDPAKNNIWSQTDGTGMAALYGDLAYIDPFTGDVKYYFLKDMTPNADYTEWTLTLNPNIKFSDGTPLDAAAIKFNWDRVAASSSRYKNLAASMTTTVVDDLTLKAKIAVGDATLPKSIAEGLSAIASPTAVKAEGDGYGVAPVGAGPFKLKTLTGGQSIELVRNEQFASFRPGQPYLDSLTVQYLPDISQAISALNDGSAQIVYEVGGGANDRIATEIPDSNYYRVQLAGGTDIFLNEAVPPFDDVRARKAISLAFDRAAAADAHIPGNKPKTNLFPETSPFFDAKYNYPDQDTAEAQKLFDELAAEGKPVNFTYVTNQSPQNAGLPEYMQAVLSTFKNVTMTVDKQTSADYQTTLNGKKYQATTHGLYAVSPVPDITDYYQSDGPLNLYGYKSDVVDGVIKQLKQTDPSDTATQKKLWGELQQQVNDDYAVYWMGAPVMGLAASNKLTGIIPINYGIYPQWGDVAYKQ